MCLLWCLGVGGNLPQVRVVVERLALARESRRYLRVWGAGLGVEGLVFGVWGVGMRVEGLGTRVEG